MKKFFNTSGLLYKELGLKDKLPTLTEEQIALQSADGMLVKRPMLIGDGFVLVGFKEDAWEKFSRRRIIPSAAFFLILHRFRPIRPG